MPDVLPNVLLVVFDTARADALEPYGAPAGNTPAVADLAARGAFAPFAISTSNWTLPSHASMFTGLLPRALGLTAPPRTGSRLSNPRPALEAQRARLLPEVLRRRGYAVGGVSANPWITRVNGFGRGMDWFQNVGGETGRESLRRRRPGWWLRALAARQDDGAVDAERILGRRLGEGPPRPFFWFVNLMECHTPYLPPRPYDDLGLLDRWGAVRDVVRYQTAPAIARVCLGELDVPPDAMARMRHLYERAVRQMDDWLGRVLERLDRHGVLDETLVIVTSDHGENFGEGHLVGHAFSVDQRLVRVPLAWAGPGASPFPAVTSLASLPRLVAEAIGLEDHPWADDACPPGTAVAQNEGLLQWTDSESRALARVWGVAEQALAAVQPMSCATDGRFKLTRMGEEERLFDLRADPGESVDVIAEHPGPAEALRLVLDRTDSPAPVTVPTVRYSDEEEREIEARLEALGYL
jgi:arylsulfatase A-like enzyme